MLDHSAATTQHDGSRVLYHANKLVHEVVLPSTNPTQLLDYSRANSPSGGGYGPDDTILVLDMYQLVLFGRDATRFEEVARAEVAGSLRNMCSHGALTIVSMTGSSLAQRASFKSRR